MADEQVALYFVPSQDGEHVIGIPARNLTESEVAEIRLREPVAFANATTPHPATGHVLYRTPTPPNLSGMKRAELNALAAERGVADAEGLPNKEAVIAALERTDEPAEAAEDAAEAFAPPDRVYGDLRLAGARAEDVTDAEPEAPAEDDAAEAAPPDESEQ